MMEHETLWGLFVGVLDSMFYALHGGYIWVSKAGQATSRNHVAGQQRQTMTIDQGPVMVQVSFSSPRG